MSDEIHRYEKRTDETKSPSTASSGSRPNFTGSSYPSSALLLGFGDPARESASWLAIVWSLSGVGSTGRIARVGLSVILFAPTI